tara:strand:- start:145 stop:639 length:495 start_codon:yes stop_codon:yes gene_type:complete
MNKILIILLTIPLIFSSCEKDEDNNNNNNNNNNNITDNIVGEWVNFGQSDNSDSYTWDPYTGDQRTVYNFLSDGTFELYIILDGIINDDYKLYGNWTKVNGSSYDISYTHNNDGQQEIVQEIATTIFYCDNNIFRTTFDSDLDYDYWQKNGYDYQVCTDNYIQQ